MKKEFNIFVEGVADARFIKQYISHLFGIVVPGERLVILNGWDNLRTEASALRMHSMSANGGVNIVIVDADKDFLARKMRLKDGDMQTWFNLSCFSCRTIGMLVPWKICWKT